MFVIPKHLHAIWVGPPLPEIYAEFMAGWRDLHPDWEFTLWGQDKPLPPMINQALYEQTDRFCPGPEGGQFRSDVARLEILYRFGGVYIDTDFECRKPLDPLLDDVECFVAWVTDEWLNNAIMGSVPGHPFVKRLIDNMPANVEAARKGSRPNRMTGPRYLTPLWRAHPEGVTVFPKEYFYEIIWTELERLTEPPHPAEYARHYWGNRHRHLGLTLPRAPRVLPSP
ncbi:MAG: hypothetical protein JW940_34175 [Polyangiaceae bacterium]|nr:hypothetical protein [Polyangiaceae bacterium]